MVTYTYTFGLGTLDIRGLADEMEEFSAKKIPPNGSTYYAMDTGKVFMFDGENKIWIEQ